MKVSAGRRLFEWLCVIVDKLFKKELDKFGSETGERYT
jgi:hypothetical protein